MIIGINKPKGPTSNQVLSEIKKITGIKKVGHAGTLDPLASGVLVVAIGRDSTKKLGEIVQKEKEYIAEIYLGKTSSTDDEEGQKTEIDVKKIPDQKDVEKTLKTFLGEITQTPPIYSAVKINGREAYKYARAGKEVEMKARPAKIFDITLLEYNYPNLKIKVITGPGVYIRTLAKDIGEKLKTGAYLANLQRTRVGQYKIEESKTPQDLTSTSFTN